MSTITKERVAEFIKNPLDNSLTRGEQMELARIALASLEAEAVAWLWTHPESENDVSLTTPHNDEDAEDALACGWSVQPLYTAMLQEVK